MTICLQPLLRSYLVGSSGLEPPTSRLSGARSNQLSYEPAVSDCSQPRPFFSRNRLRSLDGGVGASLLYLVCFKSQLYGILTRTFRSFDGDDGIRTHDPLLAGQVLSQLSYTPVISLRNGSESSFSELSVSALTYFPGTLPSKYLRHSTA